MFELFQVTAQYSNAVLVAILPHVADFAKRLELPIAQPVTAAQVRHFGCSPRSDHIGGRTVLTNGYEFSFDRGRVMLYRSPYSYYSLQDPQRIPEFYGPVKIGKNEALRIAHEAIIKLGYTDAMLHADHVPEVTEPLRIGKDAVPRFRVQWFKPDESHGENRGTSIDLEVDASTGQIQMMSLLNTNTWRPDPKVDVRPPVVGKGPQTTYGGGRKIGSVSEAYSNAFLVAILPQLSEYARKIGLSVRLPVTTNDVDLSRYICGLVENDPMAVVFLKNGTRFNFNHGQVTAFYGSDAFRIPGDKEGRVEDFYGKVNLSAGEATDMIRKAATQLGYSVKLLHLDEPPQIVPPRKYGTNTFARYFLIWQEPDQGQFRASAEVDAATRKIKGFYINDRANTNIWRPNPKVDVRPPVVAFAAQAAGPPLQSFSSPFPGQDCQVVWEAPTKFPTSVKIFKVVPAEFSAGTISNLLHLAELTPKNKRRPIQEGVFLGKDVLTYANKEDTRHVDMVPAEGFMVLNKDGSFAAPRQTPVGVPSDQQAAALALNLVRKLGLGPSELPMGQDGKLPPFGVSEATVMHKEKSSGRFVTNIISRTVSLTRQIDGIPVSGMAGISMKFGNEGKLAYLNWTWRAIKAAGECPVPSAAGFVSRIKSGKTLIHMEQAGKPVKKLTIKKVQLYYWENEGSNPQTMIYPYAMLDAETDLPGENSQTRLFVPFANE